MGLAPLLGGLILAWVFVKSCIDLANPENSESGDSWFGLGPRWSSASASSCSGWCSCSCSGPAEFFRRKPEVVGPEGDRPAPAIAPDEQGGPPWPVR